MDQVQNSQKAMDSELYLATLEKLGIEPNFWCSKEYFEAAKWKVSLDNYGDLGQFGNLSVMDEEGVCMLPSIHFFFGKPTYDLLVKGCWSDFFHSNYHRSVSTFLDYEYLYNPMNFLSLKGSKWKTFRKNHKKIQKTLGASSLWYKKIPPGDNQYQAAILELFIKWLEGRGEDEVIHGDEVMYHYLLNGKNREILTHRDLGLLGINIWDENYKYINFRYTICRPIPYLDEYMRWMFYTSIKPPKFVNDGGVLDSPGLKKFKDRLNPIRVREVHSWRKM